ncbi:hypothetical protein [Streptomyces griseosporeus]|uniref:hypothetical protein n=1 Tax=Streptomyces griseosporeus TaxID=1910 RepID=UPI0007187B38|nr:hypothetical protein SHL15_6676 [Streptomyces hygroscopicus subsp. limoneus]
MNDTWIEPCAREAPPYSPEQVERGRRLVRRDELLIGERQHTRLEIGDLLLEVSPEADSETDSNARRSVAAFAAKIGISVDSAREYRRVAAGYRGELRDRVAAYGLTISYSVIREAAIDAAGSGMPAEERWAILLRMLDEAVSSGARLTAQKYRQAIGARLTLDAGIGLTPDRILQQLDRQDVRAAVVECITEPRFLRDVVLADPATELKVREVLAEVPPSTRETPQAARQRLEDEDERLLLQLRRRVSNMRQVVNMHPEQILNIADRETLDELTEVFRTLADWIAKIECRKEIAR